MLFTGLDKIIDYIAIVVIIFLVVVLTIVFACLDLSAWWVWGPMVVTSGMYGLWRLGRIIRHL